MAQLPFDKSSQKGYAALLAVIIISAMALAAVVSTAALGGGSSKTSRLQVTSAQARGGAQACAELAFQQLITSSSYTGSGNATIGSAACTYAVTNLSGTQKRITTTGTVGTVVKKVQVDITTATLAIISWQEIP